MKILGRASRPILTFLSLLHVGTASEERLEFTRMVAHWHEYGGAEYMEFVDAARPELVQFGFYGGHFYSLVHTDSYGGYPAHFQVKGLRECGDWFEGKNVDLRKRGIKVVGHFNVEFLVGDPDGPDGPRGFFKWYREMWDEKVLGPKPPVEDPLDFIEKNKDGTPKSFGSYQIGKMREYTACLRNPHWQSVLKAWVKAGIARGVDGFVANYFYRKDCHCQYCQKGFREYLSGRFSAGELKEKFGIKDLAKHEFDEIVCWHKPEESTPLRREMLRWSQISNKEVFDEMFHKYGRSLKPDLITAQWNHIGNFGQIRSDERCLLPGELWGKGESYLWYSMGEAGNYTNLEKGYLGDGTLLARYIRGAFDDKPFTLGKYEGVRTRAAIAELAANGGAPMGFYARTKDPDARKVFAEYYGFMERNNALYQKNRPYGEVVLLYPRKAVWEGDLAPVEKFKAQGMELLNQGVLFDVIPDDLASPELLGKYLAVLPGDALPKSLSIIEAPDYVRVSANVPDCGGEVDLHFVNYNRVELPKDKNGKRPLGRGIADENPIPAGGVKVDFAVPERMRVTGVEVLEPEEWAPQKVRFTLDKTRNRVAFDLPVFKVYSVARVRMAETKK
jgi:hypothetical protein